jgi:ribosomal protein S27AE
MSSQGSGSGSQRRVGMIRQMLSAFQLEIQKRKKRRCLKCDKVFESKHKHNRLCDRCVKENTEMPEEHGVGK